MLTFNSPIILTRSISKDLSTSFQLTSPIPVACTGHVRRTLTGTLDIIRIGNGQSGDTAPRRDGMKAVVTHVANGAIQR